jgi:hypothetical protein
MVYQTRQKCRDFRKDRQRSRHEDQGQKKEKNASKYLEQRDVGAMPMTTKLFTPADGAITSISPTSTMITPYQIGSTPGFNVIKKNWRFNHNETHALFGDDTFR